VKQQKQVRGGSPHLNSTGWSSICGKVSWTPTLPSALVLFSLPQKPSFRLLELCNPKLLTRRRRGIGMQVVFLSKVAPNVFTIDDIYEYSCSCLELALVKLSVSIC